MDRLAHTVRSIRPEEWQTYRAVRLRALQDSPDAFGSTYEIEVAQPDSWWTSRIATGATSGFDHALFADSGDAIRGLAWCKVSTSEPGVADLFQMWVDPGSRGNGIGAALVRESINFARRAGVDTLRLGVTVADSPAMRLYTSFGFAPVGTVEPLREGSAIPAQTMHLQLNEST